MVSYPGHGTRIVRGLDGTSGNIYWVYFWVPQSSAARDPGHGTRIARGLDGTEVISVSLCLCLVSPLVPQG